MSPDIAGSLVSATPERCKSANMVFTWQEHAFTPTHRQITAR